MKIYGTDLCIKCIEAKEKLQELKIEYKYINITDSIYLLKEFMKFRDDHTAFDPIRGTGKVGIPCFIFENEEITFDLEEAIKRA